MIERGSSAVPLRVGVMGAGSVGSFFAARMARLGGAVTAVARPNHVDGIRARGLEVHTPDGRVEHAAVEASADPATLATCDVVLVTVKSVDTDAVAATLASVLRPDALVVSVQNGVDNAWRMHARMPQPVVPAVVYVSVEMVGPGQVRHNGGGRLIVGDPLGTSDLVPAARATRDALVEALTRVDVVCTVAADVRIDLWTKLATNCAYNAMSALGHVRYGRLVSDPAVRDVMRLVTGEIAAVAEAEGVPVTQDAMDAAVARIVEAMPGALSSTAQDLLANRRTEIDDLNGFVVRRGQAHGIATPVNRTLHALVGLVSSVRRESA